MLSIMFTLLVVAVLIVVVMRLMRGGSYPSGIGTSASGLGGGFGGSGAVASREIIVCDAGSNAVIAFGIDGGTGALIEPPLRVIYSPPAGAAADTMLRDCWDVAVTAGGDTYVLNLVGEDQPTTITMYAAGANGAVAPAGSFSNLVLTNGTGLALKGGPAALMVTCVPPGFTGIAELPRDPTQGPRGHAEPDGGIMGPADKVSALAGVAWNNPGQVLAATSPSLQSIFLWDVYRAQTLQERAPTRTIAGPHTGLSQPERIAMDAGGKIYVTNWGNASITVYASDATGDAAPMQMIGGAGAGLTTMEQPMGIAVDDTGRIYVADTGRLLVFAAGADGVAPIQVITSKPENMFNELTGVNFRIPSP